MRLAERPAPLSPARRLALLAGGIALAICLLGAFVAGLGRQAGGADRIAGIAIGDGDYTRLPRRALACSSPPDDPLREVCRVLLDNQPLVVEVAHYQPERWPYRACTVTYARRAGSCWAGQFTPGNAPYATFSRAGLQIDPATLAVLRAQYQLANRTEGETLRLIGWAALGLALVAAVSGAFATSAALPIRALIGAAFGLGALCFGSLVFTIAAFMAGMID